MKRGLLVVCGLALFVVGAFFVFSEFSSLAMHSYRIPSSAMEPTLHCARPGPGCEAGTSDRIYVARWAPFWTPSRGDIVVFQTPPRAVETCGEGGKFVKRLIGLPGETVSERNGFVFIDGHPLKEPYISAGHRDTQSGTWHVPEGQYFFLGDNRAQSCDSRQWGSVPRGNFVGPYIARFWPFDRIGLE